MTPINISIVHTPKTYQYIINNDISGLNIFELFDMIHCENNKFLSKDHYKTYRLLRDYDLIIEHYLTYSTHKNYKVIDDIKCLASDETVALLILSDAIVRTDTNEFIF